MKMKKILQCHLTRKRNSGFFSDQDFRNLSCFLKERYKITEVPDNAPSVRFWDDNPLARGVGTWILQSSRLLKLPDHEVQDAAVFVVGALLWRI